MPERPEHVQIDVAGAVVEIVWDDREELVDELGTLAGMWPTVEKFHDAEPGAPVMLDPHERDGALSAIERIRDSGATLTDGLTRLLEALTADQATRQAADPAG